MHSSPNKNQRNLAKGEIANASFVFLGDSVGLTVWLQFAIARIDWRQTVRSWDLPLPGSETPSNTV